MSPGRDTAPDFVVGVDVLDLSLTSIANFVLLEAFTRDAGGGQLVIESAGSSLTLGFVPPGMLEDLDVIYPGS